MVRKTEKRTKELAAKRRKNSQKKKKGVSRKDAKAQREKGKRVNGYSLFVNGGREGTVVRGQWSVVRNRRRSEDTG